MLSSNSYDILNDLCNQCNSLNCACNYDSCIIHNSTSSFTSEDSKIVNEQSSGHCVKATRRKHTLNSSFVGQQVINNNISSNVNDQLQSVNDIISSHSSNSDFLNFELTAKGFNFAHLNVQGLCGQNMSKFSQLKTMLNNPINSSLHLIGLSETKLKEHKSTNFFRIDGFQMPFRNDNISNGGGGIMVYVKNGINAKRRADLETNDIQCVWLEITPERGKTFLVGNMYRPPHSRIEFNDRFENFIDHVMSEDKEIILMGDFNKNLINEEMEPEWINFTTSLGLSQLVKNPTRTTETSSSLIDHIYTNCEENISRVHVGKFSISDHFAIFGNRKLNVQIKNKEHHAITYRSFRHFDENLFCKDLSEVPWEIIATFDDVDDMVQTWNRLFLEIVDKHAPIKQHRIKRNHQPEWLTSEILDLMKERDNYKINGKMNEYRLLRNKLTTMIDKAKKEMYQNKIEEGQNDPKTIWKIFQQFGASSKKGSAENILGIKHGEQVITHEKLIADHFNEFFINVASDLKQPLKPSNFEKLNSFIDSKITNDVSFQIPQINCSFVTNFLLSLDGTKSTGLDCIGPRLLKLAPNILSPSIMFIINKSITSGIFPCVWKHAKVKPLYKSGAKDDVNNYRPISILPTLSKIIEKWTHVKLMSYLNQHQLLTQKQSGFRSGHSTETALTHMTDNWLHAINDGNIVGCILVDFRKAFDLVDHRLLIQKLKHYKVNDLSLSWFDSYLNRTQQVTVNTSQSKAESIRSGVPQGSILGPLLFLIFINDLPLCLKDAVRSVDLYADDTTLYEIGFDKDILENNLQHALNLLNSWCLENGMIINIDKTKLMLISSRQKRQNMKDTNLTLAYENVDLRVTSCEKVLGVHIDDNLTWTSHFQHVSKKISTYLWLLSQIRSYLPIRHRMTFYNAYIKPHLEYCCVIWGNSFNSNMYRIEKLQRRACKLILGKDYTSLEEARMQLNMLSFEELIFINKAKVMFKVTHGLSPIYITEMFQIKGSTNDDTMTLRSDSNKNFKTPKPKLNMFKNSLSYSGALIWNSIPVDIRNSSTVDSFVNKCLKWMKE